MCLTPLLASHIAVQVHGTLFPAPSSGSGEDTYRAGGPVCIKALSAQLLVFGLTVRVRVDGTGQQNFGFSGFTARD